jgi:hypothetical protein
MKPYQETFIFYHFGRIVVVTELLIQQYQQVPLAKNVLTEKQNSITLLRNLLDAFNQQTEVVWEQGEHLAISANILPSSQPSVHEIQRPLGPNVPILGAK